MTITWQKVDDISKKKYHLIAIDNDGVLTSACGINMFAKPSLALDNLWKALENDQICAACKGAWHICCTSIQDAKTSIDNEHQERILRAALRFEQANRPRVSLVTMIERQLKRIIKVRNAGGGMRSMAERR